MPNELEEQISRALGRHMPAILAQSVRRKAQERLGVAEGALTAADLPRLSGELASGLNLFAPTRDHSHLLAEISALEGSVLREPVVLSVQREADVSAARVATRTFARRLSPNDFFAQRAATAASELVRNIVLYARRGTFECSTLPVPRPTLRMVAADQGPGIADLEVVLSGRYRSRTGLGLGLVGVKRLADAFEVSTGSTGTTVVAHFSP